MHTAPKGISYQYPRKRRCSTCVLENLHSVLMVEHINSVFMLASKSSIIGFQISDPSLGCANQPCVEKFVGMSWQHSRLWGAANRRYEIRLCSTHAFEISCARGGTRSSFSSLQNRQNRVSLDRLPKSSCKFLPHQDQASMHAEQS